MQLDNPEKRRGLRSIVQAIVALAIIVLLFITVDHLQLQPRTLRHVAYGCLLILLVGTLFYGAENLTRALKFSITKDGLDFESTRDGDVARARAEGAKVATEASAEVAEKLEEQAVVAAPATAPIDLSRE